MVVDMKRERGSVKKYYPQIKEMHGQGMSAQEIGYALGLEKMSIHNAISNMGLSQRRGCIDESKLIYATYEAPKLEKIIIDGKKYTDITPLFAPR